MSTSTRSQTRRFRAEWFALVAILILIAAVFAQALYRMRVSTETQEGDRLQVQARVVDDNLTRQFEGVKHALAGVRDELEQPGRGGEAAAASTRLKLLSSAMPGVRTMAVVDLDGTIVASSRAELLGTNVSQREVFDTPRRRPNRAVLYVSEPFKSSLGPWVVALSRVLTDTQGGFAGMVVATLDPEYFQVVLRSVLYAPDMRASLAHGDGKVFVNMPLNEQALGMSLARPGSMFTLHRQSGQPATLMTGKVLATGDVRMMAIRTLGRADVRWTSLWWRRSAVRYRQSTCRGAPRRCAGVSLMRLS